jgi:hypothetical protein
MCRTRSHSVERCSASLSCFCYGCLEHVWLFIRCSSMLFLLNLTYFYVVYILSLIFHSSFSLFPNSYRKGTRLLKSRKQCCGSGMFIPDPDFFPVPILDLRSRIQPKKEVAINFKKLNYFFFNRYRKRFESIYTELSIFNPKYCYEAGSGFWRKRTSTPDPGVKKKSTGSGSATLLEVYTSHW